MTIKTRLFLCLFLLASALGALALNGYVALRQSAAKIDTVVQDRVIPLRQLKSVADMYAVNVVDASHKIRSGEFSWAEGEAAIAKALDVVKSNWNAYSATSMDDKERALAAEVDTTTRTAAPAIAELRRLVAAQDAAGLSAFVEKKLYPAIDPISEHISKLIDLQVDVAEVEYGAADQLKNRSYVIMALVGAVAFAIMAFAGWVVTRGVVGPIAEIVAAMRALADNDLTTRAPGVNKRDEIGAMATALEVFRANMIRSRDLQAAEAAGQIAKTRRAEQLSTMIAGFEGSVGGIVDIVSSAAVEMEATAQQLTASARITSERSATVSAAAEESAVNVCSVAGSAEELDVSVAEIRRQIDRSAAMSGVAVEEAARTAHLVDELTAVAESIGGIVSMIAALADQTNLLALNATIEAARAGDSGKGFAVVASEVKQLATQTSNATAAITAKVHAIQDSSKRAASAISSIADQIRDIDAVAAAIVDAANQQGEATREIATAVSHASTGSNEVTANIAGVARAAGETGDAAGQVLEASGELSRQAERLRGEVMQFLGEVRAA